MCFVALLQAAQNRNRVLHAGFADKHRLKAAFERRVFFYVEPIFVQRRRANDTQLATCQHGLEHVACIHAAFGLSGADDGVHFVDEHDIQPFSSSDLFEHGLEPFLELSAKLCTGNQGTHVEGHESLVPQPFRHVAADDALCESFGNGGFSNARLADQHGIVFRPP